MVIDLQEQKELTFTLKVKKEVFQNKQFRQKNKIAQCYGLLLFGRTFSEDNISIITENKGVSRLYSNFIYDVIGIDGTVTINEIKQGKLKSIYLISVDMEQDRKKILEFFGHDIIKDKINFDILKTDNDIDAFLSGVYLACGTITDPLKAYQLEFIVNSKESAISFSDLLFMIRIKHGITERRGQHVIYIKESAQIENILTRMGATKNVFELMDIKIYKDIRNNVNRQTNCVTANIDKTVKASSKQIEAIKKIAENKGLDSLPNDLKELAVLRLENPDMSLRELGENNSMKLSRSAVNHRMEKLIALIK